MYDQDNDVVFQDEDRNRDEKKEYEIADSSSESEDGDDREDANINKLPHRTQIGFLNNPAQMTATNSSNIPQDFSDEFDVA